jgi:hypothetical protein
VLRAVVRIASRAAVLFRACRRVSFASVVLPVRTRCRVTSVRDNKLFFAYKGPVWLRFSTSF